MTTKEDPLPSYQKTIGLAMSFSSVVAACQMLEVMHLRGTLDILERDDEGYNVIDWFLDRAPLCGPMLDTLDKLGATDAYTQPHKGRFTTMDKQVKWATEKGPEGEHRHISHGAHEKHTEAALARMIDQVNEAWFNVDGHETGATQVVRLVACPRNAPLALAACWRRGINPNVRRPDSTLAMAAMQNMPAFSEWITAGGDVHAHVSNRRPYPIWQRWADRAHLSHRNKDTAGEIHEILKDMVDPETLRDSCQFMSARHHRGNQSEMIKLLNSIPQWMQKQRYTGSPIWLAAVRLRPLLIENLLERKRMRPDFTQRDSYGRSVWFSVLSCREDAVFDLLQAAAPIQKLARDDQGRGLLAQVINSYGGLAGLDKDSGRQPAMDGCMKQMARATTEDRGCFLDGMDTFAPEQLKDMDPKVIGHIAVQLLGHPMVASRMRSDTCVRLVDGMLHAFQDSFNNTQPTAQQNESLVACVVDLVTRQCDIPIESWVELVANMKTSWNQQTKALAEKLQVILTAQYSSLNMQKNTSEAAPQAPVLRSGRF